MPPSLFQEALNALQATDPLEKVSLVNQLQKAWLHNELILTPIQPVTEVLEPGRPGRPTLVQPRDLPRRRLHSVEGRAALVHAICHIEFNAINLALDAVQRFQQMPKQFYSDWLRVATEESRHFGLLQTRLHQLGYQYGDFDAHNGLWEMALRTRHSLVDRMALVPRVLEARGLDVTPSLIRKLQQAGDEETVAILEVILADEVDHVRIGTDWFRYACAGEHIDADQYFIGLLKEHGISPKGTELHLQARRRAGFTDAELLALQNADQLPA